MVLFVTRDSDRLLAIIIISALFMATVIVTYPYRLDSDNKVQSAFLAQVLWTSLGAVAFRLDGAHVAAVPAQLVVVVDSEEEPGLHVHGAGCADAPAHTLPAPQPVVEHVADVVTQALDVVEVEANPAEHLHATAWAAAPAQL